MKKIIFYNVTDRDYAIYQEIGKQEGILVGRISDASLTKTLGEVFASEEKEFEATNRPYSYLFMQDLDQEELIHLVKSFEENGVGFEGIKVMRTKNNESWLLKDVMEETQREHFLAAKVILLQEALKSCNDVDMKQLNEETLNQFKEVVMRAYMILKSGIYEEAVIDGALQDLTGILKKIKK